MKTQIRWTPDEWDIVTRAAFAKRMRHPEMSIVEIVNRSQDGLADNRRRRIRTNAEVADVLAGVRRLALDMLATDQELAAAKDALETLKKRPSRDEVLDGLSDQEAVARYGKRILVRFLNELADVVLERWLKAVTAPPPSPNGHATPAPAPKPPEPRGRLRVALCLVSDRHRADLTALVDPKTVDLRWVNHNRHGRHDLPNVDVGVYWKQLTPGGFLVTLRERLGEKRLIFHQGGAKTLARKIKERAEQ